MARLIRLVLIVILIAGSILMAPARGRMAGLSQIEICSGAGRGAVTLDARGPVGPHLPCPDCIACVAVGPLPDGKEVQPVRVAMPSRFPPSGAVAAAERIVIHPAARDPPSLA